MLWLTWLLLSLGIAGTFLGLRGRVIKREPHCRACGYDLSGIARRTPKTRCPECGRNLWLGTVMRGVRVRHRGILRASYLLLAIALVTMTVAMLERFAVIDWHHLRSAERLIGEIQRSSAANSQSRAWAELTRRRNAGALEPEEVGDIAAVALDRHLLMLNLTEADGNQPEPGLEHARWIKAACAEGLLSSERIGAYLDTMFRPSIELRVWPRVQAGEALRAHFTLSSEGRGGFESAQAAAMIEGLLVDGEPVELDDWAQLVQILEQSRSGTNLTASDLVIPIDLGPGPHLVTFEVRYGTTHVVIGRGANAIDIGRPTADLESWPRTLREWRVQREIEITVSDDSP